jgi:hypothetical protein
MNTKLLFIKTLLASQVVLFFTLNANAQENFSVLTNFQKVMPNVYATTNGTTSFLGPYSNSQRTYQLLIAESELVDLVNKDLISLSFRNSSTATSAFPTSDVTFTNYDIYLSGSVNPANRSLTFANNIVGTQTQVRSGSLVIPASSLTFGNSPNEFSFTIEFTSSYTYTGGNLLIDIRHTGFSGTSRSVDAIGTSVTGYGTLFSACWQGSYAGTSGSQGNFAVVNLITSESLGIADGTISKINVYPNPTTSSINFDRIIGLKAIKVYSLVGQLLLKVAGNENLQSLDLNQLTKGTYLMQFETDNAVVTKKIVKI